MMKNIKEENRELILFQCEAVVKLGFDYLFRTARALEIIKNRELYKSSYTSFEDYCKEKLQLEAEDVISFIELLSVNLTQKKEIKCHKLNNIQNH